MTAVSPKRARLDWSPTSANSELQPCLNVTGSHGDGKETLDAPDVGIHGYVSPHVPGFCCTLKNRWEDFMVREVSDGIVAQLTSIDPTDQEPDKLPECATHTADALLEPYRDQLVELIDRRCDQVKFKAPESKETRTAIHTSIRNMYPHLESTTLKEENHQVIIVTRSSDCKATNRIPKRARSRFTKTSAYCRFVLYKEGKDTISAIQLLSRCLHVGPGLFAYAGTKDRRAITTQFVTVKGVDSHRLCALNRKLQGIRLGNFSYVSKPLFLGDLDGNRFVIVLRSVDASTNVIHEAIEAWKQNGFVNYYGLQRFGHSAKSKSFEIGRYLIQGKWDKAIDLILAPTGADLPLIRQVKEDYLATGDADRCATMAPPSIERQLLTGIAKHGKTLNALQLLPRNLRKLYVHSYQSLIWNRVASRRVAELQSPTGGSGPHTIAGDLYFPSSENLCWDVDIDDESDSLVVNGALNPEDVSSCTTEPLPPPPPQQRDDPDSIPCPKVATPVDCTSIPVTDVVLPLPGFAVRYPENQSGQWYRDLLEADGLNMSDLRHRVKDFSLPGSYRALIVKPKDVCYEVRQYTDPNVPLIESDRQLLEKNKQHEVPSNSQNASQPPSEPGEKYDRALILQFTLPKSSYATIAIRELTKSVVEKH